MDDHEKQYSTCFIICQDLSRISNTLVKWNLIYILETPNFGQNQGFFVPCDLEIWWMTLKNNRAPLPYYVKLCASLQSHWWIQTWVTVLKRSLWVKIGDFLSCVTLKFDRGHWKTRGHLFYAASGFVHHFVAIIGFKLELQSRNSKFGSKSIFLTLRPLKIDGWPWKTIGPLS